MMGERPRIKIEPDKTDKTIRLITLIVVATIIAFSIWLFSNSPEMVPGHFDMKGRITRYDHKITLFIMPAIALLVVGGLSLLLRYPHIFNYPQNITAQNAASMYRKGVKLLRWLALGIAVLFLFFEYEEYVGIKNKFLPMHWWELFLGIAITMLVPLIISIAAFKRNKK